MVPPADFPATYAAFAAANFTVMLGGFGATNASAVAAQLAAATALNFSVLVAGAMGRINVSLLPPLSASPALLGYQLADEPAVGDFASLSQWMQAIKQQRPGALRFINLLPNYASPGQFGAATYGDYVQAFIAQVQPDLLCFDHYPRFDKAYADPADNMTRAGYIDNLQVIRAAALQHDLPFYNFFNIMPYDDHPDMTENQLRWQAMASLIHGVKGVLYFTYWTPVGGDFSYGGGIITPRGSPSNFVPGPHYPQAAALNAVLRHWGNVLYTAVPTNLSYIDAQSPPSDLGPGLCITNVTGAVTVSDAMVGDGLFVSQFRLADGRAAVLIFNNNVDFVVWPTIALAPGVVVGQVQELLGTDPNPAPFLDDAPNVPGLQLMIPAASVRFLLVPKGMC